jgi:hypothetical protein
MTALHDDMVKSLVLGTPDQLSTVSGVDVSIHNVVAYADRMVWDFDMKNYWLTKSRWSTMVRQYLDPDDVQAWLDKCSTGIGRKGRGIAVLRTRTVAPRGGAATGHSNKETRRWGSCMLTISYKADPKPQITLHSRTSYLGYIGVLDMGIAWMLAKYLAHELKMPVEDISFMWYNEAIQWHYFKSLAWMLSNPDLDDRKMFRRLILKNKSGMEPNEVEMVDNHPAIYGSRRWLMKLRKEDAAGSTYGDMTYNTYRRVRRRFHTEVLGHMKAQTFEGWSYYKQGEKAGEEKEFFKAYPPLPSVGIDDLDLSAIKMPFGKRYGGDFVGGDDIEDDDDE